MKKDTDLRFEIPEVGVDVWIGTGRDDDLGLCLLVVDLNGEIVVRVDSLVRLQNDAGLHVLTAGFVVELNGERTQRISSHPHDMFGLLLLEEKIGVRRRWKERQCR